MTILTTVTNIILHIKQKTDVKNIAIYEKDKNEQVLTDIQFIDSVSVTDDKKLMEHPKEDGTMITDHIVDDPKQVSLLMLISDDDSSSLNEILDYYKNSTPLTIKVKNEIFTNLVIESKPVKVDSEHFDKTLYELSLKEVQVAITQYVKMSVPQVKQKKNASKVKTGQKQPQKQVSIAAKLKNKIGL